MKRFQVLDYFRSLFDRDRSSIGHIHALRATFARLGDTELRAVASKTEDLPGWIALSATAASRVLGQDMYDVQLGGRSRWHVAPSPRCRPARGKRWRPCRQFRGLRASIAASM